MSRGLGSSLPQTELSVTSHRVLSVSAQKSSSGFLLGDRRRKSKMLSDSFEFDSFKSSLSSKNLENWNLIKTNGSRAIANMMTKVKKLILMVFTLSSPFLLLQFCQRRQTNIFGQIWNENLVISGCLKKFYLCIRKKHNSFFKGLFAKSDPSCGRLSTSIGQLFLIYSQQHLLWFTTASTEIPWVTTTTLSFKNKSSVFGFSLAWMNWMSSLVLPSCKRGVFFLWSYFGCCLTTIFEFQCSRMCWICPEVYCLLT